MKQNLSSNSFDHLFLDQLVLCLSVLLLLSACGSKAPNKRVKIDQVFGGKFQKVCISDQKIWIARAYEVQQWSLQDQPQIVKQLQALDPNTSPPIAHIECTQKEPVYLTQPLAEVDDPKQKEFKQKAFEGQKIEPHKHVSILIQEDGVLLHDQKNLIKAWKFNAVSLTDAILDGDFVWAISKQGLWRWKTTHKNAELIDLPKDIQGPIIDLHKDGDWLLLKNQEKVIYPIQVIRSQTAEDQEIEKIDQGDQPFHITEGKHSPFKVLTKKSYQESIAEHHMVELGFQEGKLKFEKGQIGFSWKKKGDDQFHYIMTPLIHHLLILDDHTFLLATQQGVSIWSYEADSQLQLKEIQNIPIGETIQAFMPSQIVKKAKNQYQKSEVLVKTQDSSKKEDAFQENDLYLIGKDFGFAKGKWQINFTESDLK
jgi:hypothetical protein